VSVTDAAGATASDSVSISVAVYDREGPTTWANSVADVKLTGDWRTDLVNIAQSQLGYTESKRDFIYVDGKKCGYTRYGHWYGSTYAEWCAMFVSFCLNYAEIPAAGFPREAGCEKWKNILTWKGTFMDEDEYIPQPGDLIFFNWDEESDPDHVGIVEKFDGEHVYTIEGNAGKMVRRRTYAANDSQIMGYGNTTLMMEKYGLDPEAIAALVAATEALEKAEAEAENAEAETDSENLPETDVTEDAAAPETEAAAGEAEEIPAGEEAEAPEEPAEEELPPEEASVTEVAETEEIPAEEV